MLSNRFACVRKLVESSDTLKHHKIVFLGTFFLYDYHLESANSEVIMTVEESECQAN